MTEKGKFRPFTGDAESTIRLANPPLRLVLCQLAWPDLTHLQGDMTEIAKRFGLAIAEYPIYSEHRQSSIIFSPTGVSEESHDKVFHWISIDGQKHVTLGRQFLSFYCTTYSSFKEFSEELEKVLKELKSIINVPTLERVGVRYVNQVTDGEFLKEIRDKVSPHVLGFPGLDFANPGTTVISSQNQVSIKVEDAVLQARSGLIPPGETADPAIPPHDNLSWVLDLDSTMNTTTPFEVDSALESVSKLASVNYDFFKFVTNAGFLKLFGSE